MMAISVDPAPKATIDAAAWLDLARQLEAAHPGLKLDLTPHRTHVTLSRIVVPKEGRNRGIGSAVMRTLLDWADRAGTTLTLTPSADFGGSKVRLTEWYRSMGFALNHGRYPESTDSMVRHPHTDTAPARTQAQAKLDALEARFEAATEAVKEAGRQKRLAAKAFNPLRRGGAPLDETFLATMKSWVQADIDLRAAIERRLEARDAWLDLWAAARALASMDAGPRVVTRNPVLAAYAREMLGTQAPRGEQLRIVPSPQPETDRPYDLGR